LRLVRNVNNPKYLTRFAGFVATIKVNRWLRLKSKRKRRKHNRKVKVEAKV
jgi:hypothetical protein